MKTTRILLAAFCACILFVSCKTSNPTSATDTGTPTAVGTPIGTPSSASIDASGGSLLSPDGRLEVIIPPNALSSATLISIQPVTNEAPAGTGVGYYLTPHGQKFSTPVTLRFHYDANDRSGTDIQALTVATQKDDHIWYAFNAINLDSSANTLSVSTSHFSWYSVLEYFKVVPDQGSVKINGTLGLTVAFLPFAPVNNDPNDGNSPVNSVNTWPNADEVSWTINGNLQGTQSDGIAAPASGSSTTTYTAPASTKNMSTNPVSVTATVSLPGKNQFFSTAKKLYLISNIKVTDGEVQVYKIDVNFKGTKMAVMSDFTFDYTQHSSFTATRYPDEDTIRYSNIINDVGQINNWVEKNKQCKHAALDNGNFLHITGFLSDFVGQSTGQVDRISPHMNSLLNSFAYSTDCGNGPKTTLSSTGEIIYAPYGLFILNGTAQTLTDSGSSNINGAVVTFTLTPQ